MSFLNLDGGSGSARIVERLILERKRRIAKSVGFDAVHVDEAILQAAVLLFRDRQQQHYLGTPEQSHNLRIYTIDSGRKQPKPKSTSSSPTSNNKTGDVKLEKLCINNCPANPYLEYLIEAAMGMDLFQEFELQGNMEEEEERAAELEAAAVVRQEQREHEAIRVNEHESNTACDQGHPNEDPDGEGGDENGDEGYDAESAVSPTSNIFALDALGFRIRFSTRLRRLELINLPMTRDHAESLMYGIETNATTATGCRLDALVMEGVRFVHDDDDGEENDAIEEDVFDGDNESCHTSGENDGEEAGIIPTTPGDGTVVVKELCEGFPNNCTLKTIELQRCRLTDAQIALIFDSVAHHPTLTNINLSENSCRKLGLEALDRILVSPQCMPQSVPRNMDASVKHYCKIESLDLSYQFTSEETYGTREHIQLDILTRNCTTKDDDIRIYPNLRKLVLQGNQIDDSAMEDLAFLVRHRFPRLEELDLRFNEITTEGLEAFANHSDPSNDSYMASNSDNGIGNDCHDTDHIKEYIDHFPPLSSRLRTIRLTNNPLVMTNQTSIVILKLLKIYPVLQNIQSNLEWEDETSIAQYIQHLLDINRAGRILLLAGSSGNTTNSDKNRSSMSSSAMHINSHEESASISPKSSAVSLDPIPLAAWPLVLARLTRKARYPHYIPKKNSLNGMYYLIRYGPIVMEQMASRVDKGNTNKKNNNDGIVVVKPCLKRKWGDPALGGYETLADFLRCELGTKA